MGHGRHGRIFQRVRSPAGFVANGDTYGDINFDANPDGDRNSNRCHGNRNANQDGHRQYPDSDRNDDKDSYRDCNRIRHDDQHRDRNVNGDCNDNRHGDTYRDGNVNSNCHSDDNGDCYCHGNSDTDSNSDLDSNCNRDRKLDADANSNCHIHSHRHRIGDRNRHANSNGDRDAGPFSAQIRAGQAEVRRGLRWSSQRRSSGHAVDSKPEEGQANHSRGMESQGRLLGLPGKHDLCIIYDIEPWSEVHHRRDVHARRDRPAGRHSHNSGQREKQRADRQAEGNRKVEQGA